MRYLNLFNRVTRIRANHCFLYNNMVIFAVPKNKVAKAIGPNNSNLKKISEILSKRIRIVAEPEGREDLTKFVTTVVSPVQFKSIEAKDSEVVITAGREGKARLIGRGRIRQKELQNILEQYFGIKILRFA